MDIILILHFTIFNIFLLLFFQDKDCKLTSESSKFYKKFFTEELMKKKMLKRCVENIL
jgi:hypothetical protein